MKLEVFEGDARNFQDRVIWVVRHFAGKPPRYKQLEENFDISARKWQNMCNRVQQPTIEMVTALATAYPKFSEWLLTGEVSGMWQQDPTVPQKQDIDLRVLDDPVWDEEQQELCEALRKVSEAFFVAEQSRKARKTSVKKKLE